MACTWSCSTSFFAAARPLAGVCPSSYVTTLTGCPLIPPWLLTHEPHALMTSALRPMDGASGPVQLQMNPSTIGSPLSPPLETSTSLVVLPFELSAPHDDSVNDTAATSARAGASQRRDLFVFMRYSSVV